MLEKINVGGAISAISLSPDGNQVVVAGREILKIYKVENLAEVKNLRVGQKNLNYSSVDVKWHPMERTSCYFL